MYQTLDEKEIETIKKAEKITRTDYGIKGKTIPVENYIGMVEELVYTLEELQNEFERYKEYVRENYRFVPYCE